MRRLLYYLYYFPIGLPLFLISLVITTTTIIIACYLGFGDWASRWPGFVWSRLSLWLHWSPVKIIGTEHLPKKGETYVVIANHQSMFDIFVLYGHVQLPFKWVLKESLRHMPFIGKACEAAKFIFVDDSKVSSIASTMEQGKETLESGHSIFIFPEGSRTENGKVSKFKKGAFVMAHELNVPLLPITIDGAYDILPKHTWLPHPHRITLTIHAPISTKDYGDYPANIAATARESQKIISAPLQDNSTGTL